MESVPKPIELCPQNGNDSTLILGIVNVTPDSFSDGGRYLSPKNAILHAYQLLEEGADVLDIGAESTRPGSITLSAEEEWARLEPVLKELCSNVDVTISLDTYKASIASKALEYGVSIINDIWGGMKDEAILNVVSDAQCHYIWMHNRDVPTTDDAFACLLNETHRGIETALNHGISQERLWIDPGIGFGKTYEHNLQILKRMDEYCKIGPPVLLGTSRKSVIGNTLHLPPDERLEGSLATVALGVRAGVQAVRVHDVLQTRRTCRMVEAILNAK